MTCCQACGCSEASSRKEEAPPLPPDAQSRLDQEAFDMFVRRVGTRMAKFACRALLLVLLLYFYESMKRYVTNSIEVTWFSKFVVIAVAVPMADVFIILAGLFLD
ncbi:hypothetical protein EJB05_28782 [Eragrostis curvula]|uniref:Uncharacterized protein n=1 Tax=Eragrostis curvula TaxID=38414 RepID=A0A5J9URU8_9POAL|nr:hypothetical protein EJB05_28782 [Eragrostis curvula]